MTLRRTLPLLAATLLTLLAIGNPAPTAATEDGTGGETITTRLYPGWNMVGWLSDTTTIAELFETIPELREVVAWDAEEQEFQRSAWTSTEHGLAELTPGQGIWLDIDGDTAFDWERPVSEDYVLLSLQAGANLVGWSGPDGFPMEDAVRRFGDALHYAYRWDAEGQRFDRYVPDGGGWNSLGELSRGDALWVGLAEEARWWQSGTGGTRFAFDEGVSGARRAEIQRALTHVIGFFAERYAIEPPAFTLSTGEGAPTAAVTLFAMTPPATEYEVYSDLSVDTFTKGEQLEIDLAHEYFHVLQANLARGPGSPSWMTEGSATYAAAVYAASMLARDSATIRQSWLHDSATFTGKLKELEVGAASSRHFRRVYDLGAMGVDWLVGHSARRGGAPAGANPGEPLSLREQAEHESFIEHYRLLLTSETWQEAFETAFGVGPGDFYREFERYREELAGPIVLFFGDVPEATRAAYKALATSTYTFLVERLGVRPFTYFSYIAADEESGRQASETRSFCQGGLGTFVVYYELTCGTTLTGENYLWRYFWAATWNVDLGGRWLELGIQKYVENRYAASTYDTVLDRQTFFASHFDSITLSELVDRDSWEPLRGPEKWALAFVAVDRLIAKAGEGALKEYVRLAPRTDANRADYQHSAGSWQAAFEQAFGLTVEEFYEDFAEYRAGLRQP